MESKIKSVFIRYEDNIYEIKVNISLSSNEIKKQIVDIICPKECQLKEAELLVIISPSCSATKLYELDYYFLTENTAENPYFVEFQHSNPLINNNLPLQSSIHEEAAQPDCHHADVLNILNGKLKKLDEQFKNITYLLQQSLDKFYQRQEDLMIKIKVLSQHRKISQTNFQTRKTASDKHSILDNVEQMIPSCPDPSSIIPSPEHLITVYTKLHSVSYTTAKEIQLSRRLKEFTFNNWEFSDYELIYLVRKMYLDMDFLNHFRIPSQKFEKWLFDVYRNYNMVHFHNYKHAFMVTQMMYSLVNVGDLETKFSKLEHMILITASICHDLHHPGFNNSYQINSRSPLAQLYNDQSPLENHHLAIALSLLQQSDTNIFAHLTNEQQIRIRSGLIKCILATDMAKHNEILVGFKAVNSKFDWSSTPHRDLLMMILIKSSDISNESRPLSVATPWIDVLFKEFFAQSDYEKKSGLPVAPFMDRDHVTKAASQCGFIRFVIYPLFHSLAQLIPQCHEHLVGAVLSQLDYYSRLDSLGSCNHRRNSHQPTMNKHVATGNINSSTNMKSIITGGNSNSKNNNNNNNNNSNNNKSNKDNSNSNNNNNNNNNNNKSSNINRINENAYSRKFST